MAFLTIPMVNKLSTSYVACLPVRVEMITCISTPIPLGAVGVAGVDVGTLTLELASDSGSSVGPMGISGVWIGSLKRGRLNTLSVCVCVKVSLSGGNEDIIWEGSEYAEPNISLDAIELEIDAPSRWLMSWLNGVRRWLMPLLIGGKSREHSGWIEEEYVGGGGGVHVDLGVDDMYLGFVPHMSDSKKLFTVEEPMCVGLSFFPTPLNLLCYKEKTFQEKI